MRIDLEQLLRARLYVARLGERDVNKWWRSDGIIGEDGAFVGPRVLPRTHATGRARIAFAVARHACDERFPNPEAHHLFRLDPEVEDRFDAFLAERLTDEELWSPLITSLEAIGQGADVAETLVNAGVASSSDLQQVEPLELGPAGRSLPLLASDDVEERVRLLAAGFARSDPGELAVPYYLAEVTDA